ncbi:MAG: type IX secretion system membrane protein PorP/SprF [Bacteroidota bacterium]
MKKTATLALVILFSAVSYAQQLPYHSQYMFNDFLINPAVAGSKDYFPIMLTYRNQWIGFKDAPETMTLSMHGPVTSKQIKIGGILFTDKTGPTSRSGAALSYVHHLQLGKDKVSFGLSAILFQYILDKSELTTDEPGDKAIDGGTVKKIVPEATFGVYYYGKNYYAGFSVPQLIQMKVNIGGSQLLNKMVRHYFLTAGYKFDINDNFSIEPSLLLKAITAAPVQIDINSKLCYQMPGVKSPSFWLGFSYRTEESVIALLGAEKSNFSFGYSYDFTLTNIKKYSTGSHEIFAGYNLPVKKGGRALVD